VGWASSLTHGERKRRKEVNIWNSNRIFPFGQIQRGISTLCSDRTSL